MIFALLLLLPVLWAFDLAVSDHSKIKLTFNLPQSRPLAKFYETFPPIDPVVVQNFLFTTDFPLIVNLHDAFCTGNRFLAYDNYRIMIDEQSILNFCGISANNLEPIRSPDFKSVDFYMDAGTHSLVVVVFHSPIGSQRTSLRITLKPIGDDFCNVNVLNMEQKSFANPFPGFGPKDFNLDHFLKTKQLQ